MLDNEAEEAVVLERRVPLDPLQEPVARRLARPPHGRRIGLGCRGQRADVVERRRPKPHARAGELDHRSSLAQLPRPLTITSCSALR